MKTNGYIALNKDLAKLLPNKTMIRVIIKDVKILDCDKVLGIISYLDLEQGKNNQFNGQVKHEDFIKQYAKYQVGDILWIKEPAEVIDSYFNYREIVYKFTTEKKERIIDTPEQYRGKKIPKWLEYWQEIPNGCIKEMARYFIKITSIKIEKLQDIKPIDIYKEFGVDRNNYIQYIDGYEWAQNDFTNLWNSTAPKDYNWEDNPYVFVYEWEYVK